MQTLDTLQELMEPDAPDGSSDDEDSDDIIEERYGTVCSACNGLQCVTKLLETCHCCGCRYRHRKHMISQFLNQGMITEDRGDLLSAVR